MYINKYLTDKKKTSIIENADEILNTKDTVITDSSLVDKYMALLVNNRKEFYNSVNNCIEFCTKSKHFEATGNKIVMNLDGLNKELHSNYVKYQDKLIDIYVNLIVDIARYGIDNGTMDILLIRDKKADKKPTSIYFKTEISPKEAFVVYLPQTKETSTMDSQYVRLISLITDNTPKDVVVELSNVLYNLERVYTLRNTSKMSDEDIMNKIKNENLLENNIFIPRIVSNKILNIAFTRLVNEVPEVITFAHLKGLDMQDIVANAQSE